MTLPNQVKSAIDLIGSPGEKSSKKLESINFLSHILETSVATSLPLIASRLVLGPSPSLPAVLAAVADSDLIVPVVRLIDRLSQALTAAAPPVDMADVSDADASTVIASSRTPFFSLLLTSTPSILDIAATGCLAVATSKGVALGAAVPRLPAPPPVPTLNALLAIVRRALQFHPPTSAAAGASILPLALVTILSAAAIAPTDTSPLPQATAVACWDAVGPVAMAAAALLRMLSEAEAVPHALATAGFPAAAAGLLNSEVVMGCLNAARTTPASRRYRDAAASAGSAAGTLPLEGTSLPPPAECLSAGGFRGLFSAISDVLRCCVALFLARAVPIATLAETLLSPVVTVIIVPIVKVPPRARAAGPGDGTMLGTVALAAQFVGLMLDADASIAAPLAEAGLEPVGSTVGVDGLPAVLSGVPAAHAMLRAVAAIVSNYNERGPDPVVHLPPDGIGGTSAETAAAVAPAATAATLAVVELAARLTAASPPAAACMLRLWGCGRGGAAAEVFRLLRHPPANFKPPPDAAPGATASAVSAARGVLPVSFIGPFEQQQLSRDLLSIATSLVCVSTAPPSIPPIVRAYTLATPIEPDDEFPTLSLADIALRAASAPSGSFCDVSIPIPIGVSVAAPQWSAAGLRITWHAADDPTDAHAAVDAMGIPIAPVDINGPSTLAATFSPSTATARAASSLLSRSAGAVAPGGGGGLSAGMGADRDVAAAAGCAYRARSGTEPAYAVPQSAYQITLTKADGTTVVKTVPGATRSAVFTPHDGVSSSERLRFAVVGVRKVPLLAVLSAFLASVPYAADDIDVGALRAVTAAAAAAATAPGGARHIATVQLGTSITSPRAYDVTPYGGCVHRTVGVGLSARDAASVPTIPAGASVTVLREAYRANARKLGRACLHALAVAACTATAIAPPQADAARAALPSLLSPRPGPADAASDIRSGVIVDTLFQYVPTGALMAARDLAASVADTVPLEPLPFGVVSPAEALLREAAASAHAALLGQTLPPIDATVGPSGEQRDGGADAATTAAAAQGSLDPPPATTFEGIACRIVTCALGLVPAPSAMRTAERRQYLIQTGLLEADAAQLLGIHQPELAELSTFAVQDAAARTIQSAWRRRRARIMAAADAEEINGLVALCYLSVSALAAEESGAFDALVADLHAHATTVGLRYTAAVERREELARARVTAMWRATSADILLEFVSDSETAVRSAQATHALGALAKIAGEFREEGTDMLLDHMVLTGEPTARQRILWTERTAVAPLRRQHREVVTRYEEVAERADLVAAQRASSVALWERYRETSDVYARAVVEGIEMHARSAVEVIVDDALVDVYARAFALRCEAEWRYTNHVEYVARREVLAEEAAAFAAIERALYEDTETLGREALDAEALALLHRVNGLLSSGSGLVHLMVSETAARAAVDADEAAAAALLRTSYYESHHAAELGELQLAETLCRMVVVASEEEHLRPFALWVMVDVEGLVRLRMEDTEADYRFSLCSELLALREYAARVRIETLYLASLHSPAFVIFMDSMEMAEDEACGRLTVLQREAEEWDALIADAGDAMRIAAVAAATREAHAAAARRLAAVTEELATTQVDEADARDDIASAYMRAMDAFVRAEVLSRASASRDQRSTEEREEREGIFFDAIGAMESVQRTAVARHEQRLRARSVERLADDQVDAVVDAERAARRALVADEMEAFVGHTNALLESVATLLMRVHTGALAPSAAAAPQAPRSTGGSSEGFDVSAALAAAGVDPYGDDATDDGSPAGIPRATPPSSGRPHLAPSQPSARPPLAFGSDVAAASGAGGVHSWAAQLAPSWGRDPLPTGSHAFASSFGPDSPIPADPGAPLDALAASFIAASRVPASYVAPLAVRAAAPLDPSAQPSYLRRVYLVVPAPALASAVGDVARDIAAIITASAYDGATGFSALALPAHPDPDVNAIDVAGVCIVLASDTATLHDVESSVQAAVVLIDAPSGDQCNVAAAVDATVAAVVEASAAGETAAIIVLVDDSVAADAAAARDALRGLGGPAMRPLGAVTTILQLGHDEHVAAFVASLGASPQTALASSGDEDAAAAARPLLVGACMDAWASAAQVAAVKEAAPSRLSGTPKAPLTAATTATRFVQTALATGVGCVHAYAVLEAHEAAVRRAVDAAEGEARVAASTAAIVDEEAALRGALEAHYAAAVPDALEWWGRVLAVQAHESSVRWHLTCSAAADALAVARQCAATAPSAADVPFGLIQLVPLPPRALHGLAEEFAARALGPRPDGPADALDASLTPGRRGRKSRRNRSRPAVTAPRRPTTHLYGYGANVDDFTQELYAASPPPRGAIPMLPTAPTPPPTNAARAAARPASRPSSPPRFDTHVPSAPRGRPLPSMAETLGLPVGPPPRPATAPRPGRVRPNTASRKAPAAPAVQRSSHGGPAVGGAAGLLRSRRGSDMAVSTAAAAALPPGAHHVTPSTVSALRRLAGAAAPQLLSTAIEGVTVRPISAKALSNPSVQRGGRPSSGSGPLPGSMYDPISVADRNVQQSLRERERARAAVNAEVEMRRAQLMREATASGAIPFAPTRGAPKVARIDAPLTTREVISDAYGTANARALAAIAAGEVAAFDDVDYE